MARKTDRATDTVAEVANELNAQAGVQPPARASGLAGLVIMTKDGQALEVHPSCVEEHQGLGWQVAG